MFGTKLKVGEESKLLAKDEFLSEAAENKNSDDELKEINKKINEIFHEEEKFKSTVKCALPGVAVNAATFFAFSYFMPGLGAVNRVASSVAGAMTHTLTQKLAGNDKAAAVKTGSRTAFAALLSEGVREVGGLVHCPIANPILSPVAQGIFHCASLRDATESDKLQKIKALVKRQKELMPEDEQMKDHVIEIRL